ncbi:Uncharacterized membrane protein YckC, RDD family [Natronoarchaeum philippinense]|uniref:Uncharacterized membrane protein YckC, RDD family n=1 Tax=Natronoarchaeum philippinense TaxID=558529 RepID=A0A285NU87_NATPI|nr:RDD family protein [Natronoarchaeum philippinense]SNZ12788.1 Uncharacterized membrane protein YckC, RDD family [Natronoarchaeum philippinense]
MDDPETATRCGVGIRGVAMTIDSFVWLFLFVVAVSVVGVVTGQTEITAAGVDTSLEGTPAAVGLVLWLGLAIGYHAFFESQSGKTLGKYLVDIRVVDDDGTPPSLRTAAVRNVLRLVDWLPAFYVVGIVALAVSDRRARLGDRLAGTTVVR